MRERKYGKASEDFNNLENGKGSSSGKAFYGLCGLHDDHDGSCPISYSG